MGGIAASGPRREKGISRHQHNYKAQEDESQYEKPKTPAEMRKHSLRNLAIQLQE